jgi:hypothetical protein
LADSGQAALRSAILTRHRDRLVPTLRAKILNVGFMRTQIAMIKECFDR